MHKASFLLLLPLLTLAISLKAEPQSGSTPAAAPSAEGTPSSRGALIDPFAGGDFGKEPTYIKSDSMTLKSEERVFVYTGNVEVRQGDMTLTCDALDGRYNQQNRIEQMVAHGNIVIVKGDGIRASGQRATYDGASQTVVLTESPELQQNESVLTADTIRIFLKENRSQAEGAVRVKLVKKQDGEKPTQILGLGTR